MAWSAVPITAQDGIVCQAGTPEVWVKRTTITSAPATGWPSLTEAERRVAALIGAGHTNKSAASALGVSINTVGTHLRAVYAKLDIQSRVQLANTLRNEMAS